MSSLTSLNCPSCNNPIGPGTKFCSSCGHQLQQAAAMAQDALLGQFVGGRFLVQAKLGEGGMGAVYQAEQVAMKRPVALKVLHPHLSRDQNLIERFHREAAACSRLNHPNTITVHDFGQTEAGTLYIAMEFVDGRSLADELEKQGAFHWTRAARIGQQIGESLADAHAAGIVHRDLKPDNVMLIHRAGHSDFVKILDFGIAKMAEAAGDDGDKRRALTRTGMIFGTPQYMSPEQVQGTSVDHRTDIYALGVILYEMLTGALPFLSETAMGMLTKHLMDPPRPMAQVKPDLDCPPPFDALVMRCLEKDPGRRYQNMNELVQELSLLASETRPGFAMLSPAPLADPSGAFQAASGSVPAVMSSSGGFGGQPTPPTFSPSGNYGSMPSAPGFGSLPSTGAGVTPAPAVTHAPPAPRKFRGAFLVLFTLLLVGGLGGGAAVAWRALDRRSAEPDRLAEGPTATNDPGTPPTPAGGSEQLPSTKPNESPSAESPQPPADQGTATVAPTDPVVATAPEGTPTPESPASSPAPAADPGARCTVKAGRGAESAALAEALAARAEQFTLCLAPLLSQSFDGNVRLEYRWSKNKAPYAFSSSRGSLQSEPVKICLQTAIQMASHPPSKRITKAEFELQARGQSGALVQCEVQATVPTTKRRSQDDKPDVWNGAFPGYGRY